VIVGFANERVRTMLNQRMMSWFNPLSTTEELKVRMRVTASVGDAPVCNAVAVAAVPDELERNGRFAVEHPPNVSASGGRAAGVA